MALGNIYTAQIENANGEVSQGNVIQFDDSVNQPVPNVNPVVSGALSTTTVSSGTGKQIVAGQTVTVYCCFTSDATNNVSTCTVALSPDNTTYSTVLPISVAAALNNLGAITLPISLVVPAGWYVKFTSVHGAVGTLTYA